MNDWQSTCLGRRALPRERSAFDIEPFFNFADAERRIIEERGSFVVKNPIASAGGAER